MAVQKQARWQCQQCRKASETEVAETGNSNIAFQFNETYANIHLDTNSTHVLQMVFCAVTV